MSKPSLQALDERHRELCRTLSATATEAAQVQIDLYKAILGTSGLVEELGRIGTFNARESRAAFEAFLAELRDKEVQVKRIIFDPVRSEFHLFAKI